MLVRGSVLPSQYDSIGTTEDASVEAGNRDVGDRTSLRVSVSLGMARSHAKAADVPGTSDHGQTRAMVYIWTYITGERCSSLDNMDHGNMRARRSCESVHCPDVYREIMGVWIVIFKADPTMANNELVD
jgi:hypothetical protein